MVDTQGKPPDKVQAATDEMRQSIDIRYFHIQIRASDRTSRCL